jgi:hypothetical protein
VESCLQQAVVSPKNSLLTPSGFAVVTIGPALYSDKLSLYSLWMAPVFADDMIVTFKVGTICRGPSHFRLAALQLCSMQLKDQHIAM